MDDSLSRGPDFEELSRDAVVEPEDAVIAVELVAVGEVATPKLVKTASKRVITADTTHTVFQPEHIVEYEWPPKSGERYFLQEQIAEFLDVKSFKRKYPDLQRRAVEKAERDYLVSTCRLGELMSDFQMQSLTTLRAIEVHELMSQDYSSLYAVYQKASAEKLKRLMVEQQREFDTIKSDSKKMEELRKRAIASASEYNSELLRDKQRERRQFWDMQTSIIQSSANRWKKMPAAMTRPTPYPVALMPGQFHQNYKKFSAEDLREMPLNTVLDYRERLPVKRPESPPAIIVDEQKIEAERARAAERAAESKSDGRLAPGDKCSFCRKDIQEKDKYVKCAQCHSNGHPACMDMSNEMYQTVKGYDWMCMDCKPCSVCKKLDEEDKMMFCDRCDRGYHTFCVGLDGLPSGRWVCANFCAKNGNGNGGNGRGSGSATPTTTGDLRCRDCDISINKDNKVHHRSKYRHSGLCMSCVNKRSA
uniref:PHD-type domain-containing protein n=1 Tax=Plectus sambesii TaxID=2011161 RepID=A0A914X6K8_9BILA